MIRWFEEEEGQQWRIRPEIRDSVRFQHHSLAEPPPRPGRFDVILCRNVLLYFSNEMRRAVFDKLASASAADAILMLGAGETVIGQTEEFVSDPDHRGLYMRRERSGVVEPRSEEHTSELKSLMRISYAVFCLTKKTVHSSLR